MTGNANDDTDERIDLGPEAFAAAFEASPTPMVVTDPRRADNPIVWANPAFLALTGYQRHELYGRNCRMMQGPLSDPDVLRHMRDAVAAGEPAECELFNYRKDGTPFWNGMTITPVRDGAGGLILYFSAQADMTDKHRLESALKAANDDLERQVLERTAALQAALEQKTALLHEVDHRVKNNLQVISALMLLKSRRTPAGPAREALQGMADRIGALSTAHRMLYSSDEIVRFDFQAFTREFLGDIFDTEGRVAIDAAIDDISVSAAMAAPLALMLHELVINAVRHGFPHERSGRVAIVGKRTESGMTLSVTDDGVGLDGPAVNPDGFGRSLVEMVVRQLRGRVAYADAAPGTRVDIFVPIVAHESAA